MSPDILIVGQGLAGTLLGWELERAGLSFAVADPGHAASAARAGAGIVNPITGRRLVKSWGVDALLPAAAVMYRELGEVLGFPLWHELRIRRLFADRRERDTFFRKRPELAPFAGAADDTGFWIERAARVDVVALLAGARTRWLAQGRLREAAVDPAAEVGRHALVVDCTGVAGARSGRFDFVPWEFSKGEVLEIAVAGLAPDVAFNRRHWVLPVGPGVAWAGATHESGHLDSEPTPAARHALEASVRGLLTREFRVTGQRAGVRVNLPDKLPVAGRHPHRSGLGLLNALGAKGTLFAPFLARQWLAHVQEGRAFAPEVALSRFVC